MMYMGTAQTTRLTQFLPRRHPHGASPRTGNNLDIDSCYDAVKFTEVAVTRLRVVKFDLVSKIVRFKAIA